jgi:hypothetical protein
VLLALTELSESVRVNLSFMVEMERSYGMNNQEWNEDKPSNEIDANEFRIISVEKLLEIQRLLEELLEVGAGVRMRVEDDRAHC